LRIVDHSVSIGILQGNMKNVRKR